MQIKTISYELARKLKKLGIKKEACFVHYVNPEKLECCALGSYSLCEGGEEVCWAYALEEILDMLPSSIAINKKRFDLIIEKLTEKTTNQHWYAVSYNGASAAATVYKTATEAAGNMLVWCIKNDHVKVEDLNNDNKTTN